LQSPFIGKRVPLVDEASQQPILYARYTAVAQILVVSLLLVVA
jgi:hypothetical protein